MSTRRRSRRKRISSGRKKTRRLSQRGGDGKAKLAFADNELATTIREGIKQGRQIYKDDSELPAQGIGKAIDQKAEALREQGKDAAAASVEASKEMTKEQLQIALGTITQKEVGFLENMMAATTAEVVSEVPGIGPLAGEVIEATYNQGKALFAAKAEFDEKMKVIKEKTATLEANKAKLAGLAANPQAVSESAALQKEIDGHKAELSKHANDLTALEKRLGSELDKFVSLASDIRIRVYHDVTDMNNLVLQAKNSKLTDAWKETLGSLEACVEEGDPEQRKIKLNDFEEKLKVVKGMEELGEKRPDFDKLAAETTSMLEQGLELHHGSKPRTRSEGRKGGAPSTIAEKLNKFQSRRQINDEARKRLRQEGFSV